jgi:molybdopterin molybdotransferase
MKHVDEISYAAARAIVEANIKHLTRVETIDIDDCPGRVLAETIVARLSVPSFDRSAMDGYAAIAADTIGACRENPKILNILCELHAGETTNKAVRIGECIKVATGAMIPSGADAVVMIENAERNGTLCKIFQPLTAATNISQAGEDIKEGETLLNQGVVLDAGKIGVLATQGFTQASVFVKPVVAVISSGEEISEPGKELKRGTIYDVNSHTIASVIQENGGVPLILGIVRDNLEQIKAKIREGLKSDIVVISGGSSVGERDMLVNALEGWGEVLFHGVQVKPGKPTLFALVQGKPLFGMPGPPTSCLIHSLLFLGPAIRKMGGLRPKPLRTVTARLERRVSGMEGRRQFLPVLVKEGEAIPVFKKSGTITSVAWTDGYIEIPEDSASLDKGTKVIVTLF